MTDEISSVCEACGASVYKEHIDSGIARYEAGKLMCAHCVSEFESAHDGTSGAEDAEIAPIAFDDDEDDSVDMSQSRIHALSASTLGLTNKRDDSGFKRPLNSGGEGATRCRLFHSKLSDGAIGFMTNAINEWLDGDKNIVIKFATSTIGPFEGKHTEPNLLVTVFY